MSTLAVCTAFAPTLAAVFLDERYTSSGDMSILSLDRDVHHALKGAGFSPILLDASPLQSWKERDTQFARLALPGVLTMPIPGTDLPAWKVLSMDRLSFWFGGARVARLLDLARAFRYDRLVMSLDLQHPLPWALAQSTDAESVAVQCGTIRTREMADLAPHLPFKHVVLRSEADRDWFLHMSGWGEDRVSVRAGEPLPTKLPTDSQAAVRSALGLTEGLPVLFVVYESQTEWAFRRWWNAQAGRAQSVVVHPVNATARRHLEATLGPAIQHMTIVDDPGLVVAADKVICFRFDETWSRVSPIQVQVQDVADRFLASEVTTLHSH